MTACYFPVVDKAQRDRLMAAQARVHAAEQRRRDAITVRNDLLIAQRARGVSVSALARVVEMDRTRVHGIVADVTGEPGGYGFRRGVQPSANDAAVLRAAQDEVVAAELALGVRKGDQPTVYDERAAVFVALYNAGVGVAAQAEALDLHRMSIQGVIDGHRRAQRLAGLADPTTEPGPGE